MVDLRTGLKVGFMLSAMIVAIACFGASEHYSNKAQALSHSLSAEKSRLSGEAALHADTTFQDEEEDRKTNNDRSKQMFDLFTHVLTGLLGLGISAASDLLGLTAPGGKTGVGDPNSPDTKPMGVGG